MVRASVGIGCGAVTAVLLLAGLAAANPVGLFESGGEASGEAHGGYYVDASGALATVTEGEAQARETVKEQARQADSTYEQAKWTAYGLIEQAEMPAMPDCTCDEVFSQLEQVGTLDVAHADQIEKALDLETGLVDAGVDVGAAAQVKAFFKDVFSGAKDAFGAIKDLVTLDTSAVDDVKPTVEELLHADEAVRGEIMGLLDTEAPLPAIDPSLSGDFAAAHATQLTGSIIGTVSGGLP
jgi:hypothetical protein